MSNLAKFRKAIEKKNTYNTGFSVINDWICTGNMGLNYIISGHPRMGLPARRSTMISGLSGVGKSYLISNMMKNAQKKGYFCIVLDTENSLGDEFMVKIGVDLSEECFLPVSVYSVEECVEFVADLLKHTTPEDKIMLVVDSLSNLETQGDIKKNEEGKVAYGQGLKEKMYKQLVRMVNSKIGHRNMIALFTTHMYVNGSDLYGNPILKPSCGSSTIFIPSVGLELHKKDLKDGREQIGISVKAKTYKTRYNSLGKTTEFDLPYDTGMDIYDGLLPALEDGGIIEKNGGWYSYVLDGEVKKFQASSLADHVDSLMDAYDAKFTLSEKEETEADAERLAAEADAAADAATAVAEVSAESIEMS